jgi:hypothetical protein
MKAMTIEFATAPATTIRPPTARIGRDGKPLPPKRTGVSDIKIAALLEKFGKSRPIKAI